MSTIENQLSQLRLNGMHSSWKAMVETRQHHELSFGDGLKSCCRRKPKTEPTAVLNA